jgi:quinol monooxygenase YgiN
MSVTRVNEFQAKDGQCENLQAFLKSIISMVESSDGCQSCQFLRHKDDPARFVIIEVWDSVEAHQASVKHIPPGTIEKAMTMLAGPPKGEYYTS